MINYINNSEIICDIDEIDYIHAIKHNIFNNLTQIQPYTYGISKLNSHYGWLSETKTKVMNCNLCDRTTDIDELNLKDNEDETITCNNCGHVYNYNELYIDLDNKSFKDKFRLHNMKNKTANKINIPTLLFTGYRVDIYCNSCRKWHFVNDLHKDKEDETITCSCGASFDFNEFKLINAHITEKVSSNIFIDDNKITFSFLSNKYHINKDDKIIPLKGKTRFTINLDTGYSYLYNTGHEYTDFNSNWKRRNGYRTNAPHLMNVTYSQYINKGFNDYASFKIEYLLNKYIKYPNLINLILEKEDTLRMHIQVSTLKYIDKYMTDYYNSKYNYDVKPLIREERDWTWDEIFSFSTLTLRNRFINLSYKELESMHSLLIQFKAKKSYIYNNGKKSKNDFTFFNRETISPLIDLLKFFKFNLQPSARLSLHVFSHSFLGNKWICKEMDRRGKS